MTKTFEKRQRDLLTTEWVWEMRAQALHHALRWAFPQKAIHHQLMARYSARNAYDQHCRLGLVSADGLAFG